jgi:hypothetical protein
VAAPALDFGRARDIFNGMSNLADILFQIQKRPAMYFRRGGSLGEIETFIEGYKHGQRFPQDNGTFGYFTQWVAAHYRVNDGPRNGFYLILEHVGEDEHRAFDEFFRLLPDYLRDLEKIGAEGIAARYAEVMAEIRRQRGI